MKNKKSLLKKIVFITIFLLLNGISIFAQQPTAQVMLNNDTLLDPQTYQFDVWLRCKGNNGVDSFNLKGFQGGFKESYTNIMGAGPLSISMLANSSQFSTNPNQIPSSVAFKPISTIPANIMLNPAILYTFGMEFHDSATSPVNAGWLRACTIKLTNSNNFVIGSPDIYFNTSGVYSTVVMANYSSPYPPDGTIPFDTINKMINPVFNGPITHYNVTGTGQYLTGSNGLTVGLSGSEPKCAYKLRLNGVTIDSTEIRGTGSPIYWYHKTAGTYTVFARKIATYEKDTLMNGSAIVTTSNTITGPADSIYGNINICTGQNNIIYYAHKITNATTYNWSYSGSGVTVNTINDTTVSLNYAANATSGILSVYGQNVVGSGTPFNLNIHVNAVPVIGAIQGDTVVCDGQYVTYTVNIVANTPSIYNWSILSGWTPTTSNLNTFTYHLVNATSGNISVQTGNACGMGNTSILHVTVKPSPAPASNITGLTSVCTGQSNVTYTVPAINNANIYNWSLPIGAAGTSNTNSITVNYSPYNTNPGNITVSGSNSNGCGPGLSSSLAITVSGAVPDPAGAIFGTTTVCQGQANVNYIVSPIANATNYIWTLPNGAIGTSTTNNITVYYDTNTVSGIITVKGNSSCGNGTASTLPIVVNPLPSMPDSITGQNPVCAGQNNVIYVVPNIINANSYVWTIPTGSVGSSTINIISLNFNTNATSGILSVKGHNACGDGAARTFPIIVNQIPGIASTISGPTPVCQGQSNVSYSVPAIPYASTYIWTTPSGASGSSTTNSIILNYNSTATSGNITVKGHNNCGDGPIKTQAIVVNPIPQSPIIVLHGDTLISNAATGNNWYNAITGIISGATSQFYFPQQSGYYYVKVTLNGCTSLASDTLHFDNTGISLYDAKDFNLKVFPNPFSNNTTFSYSLRENQKVQINISDIMGKEVQELINSNQDKGNHDIDFNSKALSSGIYFYRIKIGENLLTGKLIISK